MATGPGESPARPLWEHASWSFRTGLATEFSLVPQSIETILPHDVLTTSLGTLLAGRAWLGHSAVALTISCETRLYHHPKEGCSAYPEFGRRIIACTAHLLVVEPSLLARLRAATISAARECSRGLGCGLSSARGRSEISAIYQICTLALQPAGADKYSLIKNTTQLT